VADPRLWNRGGCLVTLFVTPAALRRVLKVESVRLDLNLGPRRMYLCQWRRVWRARHRLGGAGSSEGGSESRRLFARTQSRDINYDEEVGLLAPQMVHGPRTRKDLYPLFLNATIRLDVGSCHRGIHPSSDRTGLRTLGGAGALAPVTRASGGGRRWTHAFGGKRRSNAADPGWVKGA
jgi:hypothetical protein